MITLKEYEIYLKVKKFIEAEGCEESSIIPKLINGGWNYSCLRSNNHRIR